MEAMPRPRPPHVCRQVTEHGTVVWYFRIGKGTRTRIPAPGTLEFKPAYDAALAGKPQPAPTPYGARTMGWLIERYKDSAAWAALSKATRRQRGAILRGISESAGKLPIERIDRAAVERGIDRRKPHAARHFLQTTRGLFKWAIKAKHADSDPTAELKSIRPATAGHMPWPDDWCAAFEAKWPRGTRERVAYDLLLYTGLRRGDVVVLGRPHVKNGIATIRTEKHRSGKLGELVTFPIAAELQETLDAGPIGELTFIATQTGRPRTKEAFGNWFRESCDAAKVPGSAHGLRKTRATRAANNGATEAELEAMFGWARGSKEAGEYTRNVDRARLALQGAAKLDAERNVNRKSRGVK